MTQTISNSSGISQRTNTYAAVSMLEHAKPVIILEAFAQTRPLPPNKGVNVDFRRPITFTPSTTPLQEGVTPTARAFAYENVSTQVKQYGDLVEITDVIQDTHEDPVLNDATMQVGENVGRTTEALNWAVIRAGTNVIYTNGSTRSAVNTPVTMNAIRKAVRSLKDGKAKPITRMLDGSVNYASRAIEPSYVAVGHTNLENDIRNLAGFLPVAQYGANRSKLSDWEIGAVENIRFILSPDLDVFEDAGGTAGAMLSTGGTNADVYPLLVMGQNSWGTVPLRGKGMMTPSIIPPGKIDKSDPLGQRGYVGTKYWHAAVILNDDWMARIEAAASAL